MTLKYNQCHRKWYERVKLNASFSSVQSPDQSGRWGDKRDNSAEIVFQSFLQKALVSSSGMSKDVHSLMLSIQHFLCWPLCHPSSRVPSRMVLERLSWHVTCPNHASFISWQLPEEVPVDPQGSWPCSTPNQLSCVLGTRCREVSYGLLTHKEVDLAPHPISCLVFQVRDAEKLHKAQCGNSSGHYFTSNSSGNTCPQSSQLTMPLLTDSWPKSVELVCTSWLPLKKRRRKKKKSTGWEWFVESSQKILACNETHTHTHHFIIPLINQSTFRISDFYFIITTEHQNNYDFITRLKQQYKLQLDGCTSVYIIIYSMTKNKQPGVEECTGKEIYKFVDFWCSPCDCTFFFLSF